MSAQFWSLIIDAGKISPAELPDDLSLNISNAVLVNGNDKPTSLFVKVSERDFENSDDEEQQQNQGESSSNKNPHNDQKIYLAHFSNNSLTHHNLDLVFNGVSTKEVSFGVEGHGQIHLVGFLSENPFDDDFEGFEDEDDIDEDDISGLSSEQIAQRIKAMNEHNDDDESSDEGEDGAHHHPEHHQQQQAVKKIKGSEGKPIAKQPHQAKPTPKQGGGKPAQQGGAAKPNQQGGNKPAPKQGSGKPSPKQGEKSPQQHQQGGNKPAPKQGFKPAPKQGGGKPNQQGKKN